MIIRSKRDTVIFYINNTNRICALSGSSPRIWDTDVNWKDDVYYTKAVPMEFVKWQD